MTLVDDLTTAAADTAAGSQAASGPAAAAFATAPQSDPVRVRPADAYSLVELRVVGGAGAGRVWSLGLGVHTLGSSSAGGAVELDGPSPAGSSLRLTVGPDAEVWLTVPQPGRDAAGLPDATGATASAAAPSDTVVGALRTIRPAGTPAHALGGAPPEIRWPEGAELLLGRSVLRIARPARADRPVPLVPSRPSLPERPPEPRPNLVPWALAGLPLPIGIGAGLATGSAAAFSIATLTPALAVLRAALDHHELTGAAVFRRALPVYRSARVDAVARVEEAMLDEWTARCALWPDPAALALGVLARGAAPWRSPAPGNAPGAGSESGGGLGGGLGLRVGSAEELSAASVVRPGERPGHPDPLTGPWMLPGLPHAEDLAAYGVLGLSGPLETARALARWLVLQAAVRCAPETLGIRVLSDPSAADGWDWVGRLPHATATAGTGAAPPGAAGAPRPFDADDPVRVGRTLRGLAAEVEVRAAALRRQYAPRAAVGPRLLVVLDRASRLRGIEGVVRILTQGPAVGVFVLCLDDPADGPVDECRGVLHCAADGASLTVRRPGGEQRRGIVPDLVSARWCDRVAGALAEHGADGSSIARTARDLGAKAR
jgi:S-DNA-T family DNA segregation ATPase FtsK/SpoIIIE